MGRKQIKVSRRRKKERYKEIVRKMLGARWDKNRSRKLEAERKAQRVIERQKVSDTFKLSEDQIQKLVQLYQDQEDLWKGEDPPHDDHSAIAEDIRRKGWAYIASTLGVPNLGPAEVELLIEFYTSNFNEALELPPEMTAFSYWYMKMKFLLTAKPLPDPKEKAKKNNEELDVVEGGDDDGGAKSDGSEEYIVEIKEEANSDDGDESQDLDDVADTENYIEHVTVDQIEQDQAVHNLSQYLIPTTNQPSSSKAVDDTVVTSLFVHTPREFNGKKKKSNSGIAVPCECVLPELPEKPNKQGRQLREKKPTDTPDPSVVGKLKTVIKNQNRMIKLLEAQKKKEEGDRFDKFGSYVASTLRKMGTYESLALQPKIVELISTHESHRLAIAQHIVTHKV